MRYFDDTHENEAQKLDNGERTKITDEMLNYYLGSDNTNGEAWEMLLDILNNQWPVDDAVGDVLEHWEDQ